MSFQTGTALHVDDLLDKLRLFALADGWTVNEFNAGTGNSSELFLQFGSEAIVSFASLLDTGSNLYHSVTQALDRPYLNMYGATGYDIGSSVSSQPGTSLSVLTDWLLPNMTNYYFFSDPSQPYIHIVIEVIPNEFAHIHFGVMDKIGAFDGGLYVMGTRLSQSASHIDNPESSQHSFPWGVYGGGSTTIAGCVRCNVDGDQWKKYRNTGTANQLAMGVFQGSVTYGMHQNWIGMQGTSDRLGAPNMFNGISPLLSIPVLVQRSGNYATVGHVSDVRLINIQNIAPGETLTIGPDTWRVFPVVTKKDPHLLDNLPNTGYAGYAYKVIT